MLWCVSVTPLGDPVVPLVNWMLTASSNCRRLAERSEFVAVARAAHARHCLERDGARAAGPPIWITARNCGSRAACNSPGAAVASSGSSVFSISM